VRRRDRAEAAAEATACYRLAADRLAATDEQAHRSAGREALIEVDDRRRELDTAREQKPWPY
jgi:hypothetical protein